MVSAFHAPSKTRSDFQEEAFTTKAGSFSPTSVGHDRALKPSQDGHVSGFENDMSETEDDEVKMNCIGGVQVYMTSSDEDDFDDDEESCCSDESRGDANERGVVTFVARQIIQAPEIYRPRALLGGIMEDDDRSDASSSDSETAECDEVESGDDDCELSGDESSDEADADGDCGDDDSEGDVSVNEIVFSDLGKVDDDASTAHSELSQAEYSCEHRHLDSPSLSEVCSLSQGTPEVCDENERMKAILYEFGGDDTDILNMMDTVGGQHPPFSSKRILSSLSLYDDQQCAHSETPKRMRCSMPTQPTSPGLTSFDLGPSAYDTLGKFTHRDPAASPFSEQEAEHDRALGEELAEADCVSDRESTPVPLLSPPPSPLCVESDKGQFTTMCEWPCNLAVDCALLVTGQRSHSPVSLAMMDEPFTTYHYGYDISNGTSLTPLLRGIRVNLE